MAPLPAEVGSRIGDPPYVERYELTRLLGSGASGAVYAARDHVMDEDVAIKLLRTISDREIERMRREIGVLRMLRVPGIVGFRDEGTWNHLPFVVMDLVHGEPFPGTRSRRWEDVAEVVVGLVETLSRLHEIGFIHRDLKPSNVLTVQGRATLLDFGLARSQGEDDALDGALAGTPAYLAPEVFFGADPSPSSDLYALGVMLYEILSGRRPHEGESVAQLVQAVLFDRVVPLSERAPDVPPAIARLVMKLMSREPGARPSSALEVLRILRDEALLPKRRPRRVGSVEPLERAVALLCAGRPVDVGGRPGSGRTRLLEDAETALLSRGARVVRATPAAAPFASLVGIVEPLDDEVPDLAAATALAEQRLRQRLRDGWVLLVDDLDRIDPSSAALIRRVRDEGAVLTAVDGPGDIELGPLPVEALQGLFAGPRALLHLPDDAAALVHARVGGLPGPVVERLGAWVRAGMASWEDDRFLVEREALDRLVAGVEVDPLHTFGDDREIPDELAEVWRAVALLEPHATLPRVARLTSTPMWSVEARLAALVDAHVLDRRGDTWCSIAHPPRQRWSTEVWSAASRAAADLLPAHAIERLLRLLEGGALDAVPGAAREIATHLLDEDRPGVAWAVLSEGLAAARRAGVHSEMPELLSLGVRVALITSDRRLLNAVQVEIARCDPEDEARLGELCRLAARLLSSGGRAVIDALRKLEPFSAPEIDVWRYRIMAFAAKDVSVEEYAEWLDSVHAEVAALPGGSDSLLAWEANLRFSKREFAEAAALEELGWRRNAHPLRAIAAGLNAAMCRIEAGHFEEADRILDGVGHALLPRRLPMMEALWVYYRRTIRYRKGELPESDPELTDAIRRLGLPQQTANHLLLDAAVAWRRGEVQRAKELALDASACFTQMGRPWASSVARALAVACGHSDDVEEVLNLALTAPYPDITLQAFALIRRPVPPYIDGKLDLRYPLQARREVLSREEALRLCPQREE